MQQAKFSKCLCGLIATSLIITIALSTDQVYANANEDAVCTTPQCSEASADILRGLDNKTNPCDDFYQFACGRWLDPSSDLDRQKPAISRMSDGKYQKLHELVEQDDSTMLKQVKNMYTSCMNLTDIELRGNRPLLDLIEDLGGWPVLMNSTARQNYNTSWLELIVKFKEQGLSHDMLWDLSIRTIVRDSEYLISFNPPKFGLRDLKFYHNETIVSAYHKFMVDSAKILGATRREATSQMLEVLTFEKSLAVISGERGEGFRKFDLKYMQMLFSWVLEGYLRATLGDTPYNETRGFGMGLGYGTLLYFARVDEIVQKTEPRVLANYMIWHVVRNSVIALPSQWAELRRSFRKVSGEPEEPRWRQCLDSMLHPTNVFSPEGTLNIGLASSYARNYFSKKSQDALAETIETVRGEYNRFFDGFTWLGYKRDLLKMSADEVSYSAAHYDKLLDVCLIERFYKDLEISPDEFFANMRRLRVWSTKHSFNQLQSPDERAKWTLLSHALDDNDHDQFNYFDLTIGQLQEPLFNVDQPDYLNFAGIGYVASQVIARAFDHHGRETLDKDAEFRRYKTPSSNELPLEKCIREQYSEYSNQTNQVQLDGFRSLEENIADNRAISNAFEAYQRRTTLHGQEARLPGLNYTQDQLFWLRFGGLFCRTRPASTYRRCNNSLPWYVVIGALSNSHEFAQSFNCPSGSPMNPKKKCDLW